MRQAEFEYKPRGTFTYFTEGVYELLLEIPKLVQILHFIRTKVQLLRIIPHLLA
jgi:hypothetical protein